MLIELLILAALVILVVLAIRPRKPHD